jgi:beta-carotene hydroxylase
MLNYKADIRTIVYMLITTALLPINWMLPQVNIPLLIVTCFFAVSVSVIAHNHNHVRTFKSPALNVLMDWWITAFYGFPVFAWVPTHNMNHHRFTNREGDYTITYRVSEKNNIFTLLSYPSISGAFQQIAIKKYVASLWKNNRKRFWLSMAQVAVLVAVYAIAFLLDWKKALLYVVLPHQVALFSVMIFNYVQHVHADEQSEWNHSRNIVGPGLNLMLFNNGFHTVHHLNPGMHWSEAPAEHARVQHLIDPTLNEQSFWGMIFKNYIFAPFVPRYRSVSMRLRRMGRESRPA